MAETQNNSQSSFEKLFELNLKSKIVITGKVLAKVYRKTCFEYAKNNNLKYTEVLNKYLPLLCVFSVRYVNKVNWVHFFGKAINKKIVDVIEWILKKIEAGEFSKYKNKNKLKKAIYTLLYNKHIKPFEDKLTQEELSVVRRSLRNSIGWQVEDTFIKNKALRDKLIEEN